MKVRVILFVFVWTIPVWVFAQPHSADSLLLVRAIQHQRDVYQGFIQDNSSFYSGYEYKEIVVNSQDVGVPYFLSDDWMEGSIIYNQQFYTQVDLLFDVVNNKIITHPYNSGIKIELVYDKVNRFTMGDHVFVRLQNFSDTTNFYEQLAEGRSGLYALRKKNLSRQIVSGKVIQSFTDKSTYYITFNGKLVPIKRRSDLFKTYPEYKVRIKQQLTEKRIRFKRNFEDALIEGVTVINSEPLN